MRSLSRLRSLLDLSETPTLTHGDIIHDITAGFIIGFIATAAWFLIAAMMLGVVEF